MGVNDDDAIDGDRSRKVALWAETADSDVA